MFWYYMNVLDVHSLARYPLDTYCVLTIVVLAASQLSSWSS